MPENPNPEHVKEGIREKPFEEILTQTETPIYQAGTADDLTILLTRNDKALRDLVGDTIYANYVDELRSVKASKKSDAFAKLLVTAPKEGHIEEDPFASRRFESGTNNSMPSDKQEPLTGRQKEILQARRDLLHEQKRLHAERLKITGERFKENESARKQTKAPLLAMQTEVNRTLNKLRGKCKGLAKVGHEIPPQLNEELSKAEAEFSDIENQIINIDTLFDQQADTIKKKVSDIDQKLADIGEQLPSVYREMYEAGFMSDQEFAWCALSVEHKAARQKVTGARRRMEELERTLDQMKDKNDPPEALQQNEQLLATEKSALSIADDELIKKDCEVYERGMIPLSELRFRLFGRESARERMVELFLGKMQRSWNAEARGIDALASYKESYARILRDRLKDILLTAPSNDHDVLTKHVETTTTKLATVLSGMLSSETIERINPAGEQQLCHEVINSIIYPHYKVEIITGFGGSDQNLNIRIPAYIIPALQTIHVFKEAGVKPPKLRIVNGQALAVEFNKMDEKKAWTNAYDTNALLHDFIAVYYPDCESFVTFSTPSYEQSTRGTYHGDLIHLVRIKQPTEQDLNNPAARKEFTPLQIALAELSLLGRNRGGAEGEDNALSYIAAHTFLFGNIQRVSPDAPNGVIKFGGTTEEKFNSIQEYLASFHPVKSMSSRLYQTNTAARGRTAEGGWAGPRPIFVTVTVGGKPVYYPAGPHEISLKSIMAGSASELTLDEMIEQYKGDADHNIKDAAGDLELLKKVAGLGYVDFLKAFMKKQTKK